LQLLVDIADSDSSVEEFEDASETFTVEDDIFVDVETKRIQPLSECYSIALLVFLIHHHHYP
jgi:hypothetical protein